MQYYGQIIKDLNLKSLKVPAFDVWTGGLEESHMVC